MKIQCKKGAGDMVAQRLAMLLQHQSSIVEWSLQVLPMSVFYSGSPASSNIVPRGEDFTVMCFTMFSGNKCKAHTECV